MVVCKLKYLLDIDKRKLIMFRQFIFTTSLLVLSGCVSQTVKTSNNAPEQFQAIKFSPILGEELKVETGDEIFVEGEYIPGQSLNITRRIDKLIPGSMLIPFPITIEPSALNMVKITRNWKYFCASPSLSTATFPGLGSVVRTGDCVGIRESIDGSEMQWVVDNSEYNQGLNTIWTLDLTMEERQEFRPIQSNTPFKIKTLSTIIFDGYYGKQLHFTHEYAAGSQTKLQQFTFDYDGNLNMLVSIKGKRFTIIQANNISLSYQWEKLD